MVILSFALANAATFVTDASATNRARYLRESQSFGGAKGRARYPPFAIVARCARRPLGGVRSGRHVYDSDEIQRTADHAPSGRAA
jgi:hypothetical protein